MSKLRPECGKADANSISISKETFFFLLRDAVERRPKSGLIHGRLNDGMGGSCAMGSFWKDNPNVGVPEDLVDEVAAVNDSVPRTATPQERWKHVRSWLRLKLKVLAGGVKAGA